jgi:aminoglycoside phosphotransferase (APT) family kinase protein
VSGDHAGAPPLEAVTALLREHVGPDLEAVGISRVSVGNSQETWLVDASRGDGAGEELVLRRSVPAGVLAWTRREDEHRILAALAGRGLPVPPVYATGTLERPYVLMGRLPGAVPGRLDPGVADAHSRELGAWLARLHRLEPSELGLGPNQPAHDATLQEVRAWQGRYEAARSGPVPLLGALLAWAERAVPDDGRASVVVWGDAGPHNVLVEDGRITGLLDWELAHLGHPLEDLGAAVWACLGRFDADAVVAGYEAEAGPVDRAALDFYVALASVTRTVMLVNGVAAWIAGEITAPTIAALGLDLVALSLARAARAAGWGELPPADGRPPELPLRPGAAETAVGVARWLADDVVPAAVDRRQRRMARAAEALLRASARRITRDATADLARVEAEAVAAERAGGDPDVRDALLLDLAREWARLEPLTLLHGHPRPWRGEPLR